MPIAGNPVASTLVLAQNPSFEWSQVGEEVVILDPNLGELLRLNPVAGFLWKRLDGHTSFLGALRELCREFSVDNATAEKDGRQFLQQLVEWDMVEVIHE